MELDVDYILCAQVQNECRVCLVTNSKLYHLLDNGLQNDFFDITGAQISPDDGLPQHICYICRELLRKALAFRKKSIRTQSILSLRPDNINYGKNFVITPLVSFIQTDVLSISIPQVAPPDQTYTSNLTEDSLVKEENIQKPEHKKKFDEPENFVKAEEVDALFADDLLESDLCNIDNDSDEIGVEKEVNVIKGKAQTKTKAKKAVRTQSRFPKEYRGDIDMDTRSVKDYLLSSNTSNAHAQMLYSYLINKYIDNTEDLINTADDSDNDVIESDTDDESTDKLSKLEDEDTALIDEILTSEQTDSSKNVLYEYIKERYVQRKKPDKKRRARDLVRIKFKKDRKVVRSQEIMEELRKRFNMDIRHLSLEEQIAEIRERAKLPVYENASFKCEECFRGFQFERTYNDHMKSHDPAVSGNFKCEVCNKRFLNRRKLLRHRLHHKYKIICKECGRVCKSQHIAREHAKTHSGDNLYKCEYCSRVFSKYPTRVNHIRTKHGSVQCEICYELMAPSGLIMHNTLRHRETFKCQHCDKVFNDSDALHTHTSYATNGACNANERPCTKCGESLSSESQWISHVQEHRKITKRIKRQKYYPMNRSENLVEPQPQTRRRLSKEEKALEPERSVMCDMCGDMFLSQAAMRYHQRIHTGEKPFACTFCPKRFRLKTLLTMHINTHTGERPHKCQKCPKSFKCPTALYRHQLVHTKERRHRCTVCDKSFQTSSCVKLHVRTVHLKIPMPPRVRNRKKRTE